MTVTWEMQFALFPLESDNVKVTATVPTFAQLNEEGFATRDVILQLSVDPLFSCDPIIETAPEPFKYKVRFWQSAVGLVVSVTVTIELQVEVLPLASVTLRFAI